MSSRAKKDQGLKVFTRWEVPAVRALCDTLVPNTGAIDISADEAGSVVYLDNLLAQVPRKERFLMRAMFQMFEFQTLVTRPLSFSRFSRATQRDRDASMSGWETSNFYLRRAAFQALRSLVLWAYVDNPSVEQAMGKG